MIYSLCLVLLLVGLYGVMAKKNIIKIIIALAIMGYAVNLFLVLLAPLPQALVLMSMVIGLGIVILMVSLSIRLYERLR